MPSEVRTCEHVSRRTSPVTTAAGALPFLLALVLAVPLAHSPSPIAVSDTASSGGSAVGATAANPALAPTPDATFSALPAPVDGSRPAASDASSAPVVGPVAPSPVVGPLAPAADPVVSDITDAAAVTSPTSPPTSSPTALPDATATTAATVRRSIWKSGGARLTAPVTAPGTTSAVRTSPAPQAGPEGVLNPAGAIGTSGWQADSAAGPVTITRVSGVAGPFSYTTALQFDRPGGTGDWARALAAIANPAGFFAVGKSYTMSVWVRDLNASGKSVGLLVADGSYANRPTEMSVYEGQTDTAWHQLSRTFTATATGNGDTGVYLALPESGAMRVQVTGVSVREITDIGPAGATTAPTRRLTFDGAAGSAPSSSFWNHETGGGGWGNGELQTYTDRASNAQLDGNGNLVITARRESYAAGDGIPRRYTSARLTTEGKFVIQPGSYVEAQITAPVGQSLWPAFWLIGANVRQVGWPASGELDVLEGSGAEPTKAFNAAHMGTLADPSQDMQYGWGDGGTVDLGRPLDSGPHLYGVFFDGSSVRFYVDRRLVRSIDAAQATASGRSWPFGKPQYIVLNVAISGDGGDPTGTTFPRAMTVGGISVWSGGVPF